MAIKARLLQKKSTYCCFVDFAAAFDNVDRDLLIFALQNIGVEGHILKVIREMYRHTMCALRVNDRITEWFVTNAGVRQGQNDSSTVFAVFINSLAKEIINLDTGITIGDRKLAILLFADDIALVAETVNDLQLLMNQLYSWCIKWRMKINKDKTNVVHFRPKNQKAAEHTFKFGEDYINLTDKYRYLGCVLTEFMNVNTIADNLADAGSRCLGKLIAKFYSNKGLG